MVRDGEVLARTNVIEGGGRRVAAFGMMLAVLIAAGLLLTARPAQAQETITLTVGDEASLRKAVADAATIPGHDFIEIAPGTGAFYLSQGPIVIDDAGGLTIEGNGGTLVQHGWGPAFEIRDTSTAEIHNVVIDELEITGVQDGGAGISNYGGNVYLTNSTVHGNSSPIGGIHNQSGNMVLVNSTVSGNAGYGILNGESLDIYASTVTGNDLGISNDAGASSTIYRTIVAANGYRDVEGAFRTGGYNLVGKGDGSTGLTDGVGRDRVGTLAEPLDPGLRPLGYNESGPDLPLPQGPTPTHPLRINSPAVDAIDPANCNLLLGIPPGINSTPPFDADQRGVARPWGPACDIGAFEREPLAPVVSADAYTTGQGAPLTVAAPGVLGNDDDWGSPIVVAEPRPASGPSHGTLDLEEDGSFVYTPEAGFAGTDTFTYTASHGGLLTSDPATVTLTVEADNTPPQLTLPEDISAKATSASGAAVSFVATATDENPTNPQVSCSKSSGDTFALGETTVTCSATDAAGNEATGSFKVDVAYSWGGVLQPVNGGTTLNDYSDDTSSFRQGSTVPVKFGLSGESAGITDASAKLIVAKVSDNVAGTEADAGSTSAATEGNLFRYDATSEQYVFNWGTKGLEAGTYQLRVDLGDGTTNTVRVSLR